MIAAPITSRNARRSLQKLRDEPAQAERLLRVGDREPALDQDDVAAPVLLGLGAVPELKTRLRSKRVANDDLFLPSLSRRPERMTASSLLQNQDGGQRLAEAAEAGPIEPNQLGRQADLAGDRRELSRADHAGAGAGQCEDLRLRNVESVKAGDRRQATDFRECGSAGCGVHERSLTGGPCLGPRCDGDKSRRVGGLRAALQRVAVFVVRLEPRSNTIIGGRLQWARRHLRGVAGVFASAGGCHSALSDHQPRGPGQGSTGNRRVTLNLPSHATDGLRGDDVQHRRAQLCKKTKPESNACVN